VKVYLNTLNAYVFYITLNRLSGDGKTMEEKNFNQRRKNALDISRKSFALKVNNENTNLLLGVFKLKRSANSIA